MSLWRPCDTVETAVAWKAAIERTDGPTCLILTRQGLRHQERDSDTLSNISRGGYVLKDSDGKPDAIIIATGSEVGLAMEAADTLNGSGVKTRVVSMPSTDIFDNQDEAYRESVLPSEETARVAVEAGVPDIWAKYVGFSGKVVGISSFGESAPGKVVFEHFGFTPDNVLKAVKDSL